MSLTTEQRQSLEWMAESLTLRPLDRAAIRAALADLDACGNAVERREVLLKARLKALQDARADLDACRAALGPVAQSIRAGRKLPDNPTTAAAAYLNTAEADAVLAAAGEEG